MRKDRHTDPRVAAPPRSESPPPGQTSPEDLCQGRIGVDQFSYPLSSIGKVSVSVTANDVVGEKLLHSGPGPAAEPPNHP